MNRYRLGSLWPETSGNVSFLLAGSLTCLVAMSALVIDAGSLFIAKRRLQGMADAAALGSVGAASPQDAINQVIAGYGPDTGSYQARLASLTLGNYTENASLAPNDRFQAASSGGNAVEVTLNQTVPLYFAPILRFPNVGTVTATARASKTNLASFALGSTLVGLQGGIANAMLSALTGSSVNLSLMSYDALASANIDLLTFSNALRTSEKLQAISYTDTLNTQTTLPLFLRAMASSTSDSTAAAALNSLAGQVASGTAITPGSMIDLGSTGLNTHIPGNTQIDVNAFSMLREALSLANGGQQITMDLGATIPGIASSKVTLITGARVANSPWVAVTGNNTVTVYTEQTRVLVNTTVGATLPTGSALINVPFTLDLAQAKANLSSVSCGVGQKPTGASLSVTPAIGTAWLGTPIAANLTSLSTPMNVGTASLVTVPLLASVTGYSQIKLGGTTAQTVSFSASDIASQATRTVSTNDAVSSIASSLISNVQLQVNALGLGLSLSPLTAAVGSTLKTAAPSIDSLLSGVTGLLGVGVGQANVRINGVRCGVPALVG
ncbi:MAG TPA: TadG family pilus assembly protein [Novosphingobium sp.]|nr:TadG family pilus assembly protein [Novosphingobium sp.]